MLVRRIINSSRGAGACLRMPTAAIAAADAPGAHTHAHMHSAAHSTGHSFTTAAQLTTPRLQHAQMATASSVAAAVNALDAPTRGTASHSHRSAHAHTHVVTVAHQGSMGVITLNRPKALNALNLDMVRELSAALPRLAADPSISAYLLKGAGGKAFCAGGDIKTLFESRKADPHAHVSGAGVQEAFFREEYTLDNAIAVADATKPFVVFYDGTVMGGGVGISINASVRIATEKTVFAMPETGIGFFPDVGGSHFLPRLPKNFGIFLALTGHRLTGADVLHAGLATHYVPSESLPRIEEELAHVPAGKHATQPETLRAIHAILDKHATPAPAFAFSDENVAMLQECFSKPTVEAIQAALHEVADKGNQVAVKALAALHKMSPTSLKVTLAQMHRGAALSLADCYKMELRMAMHFMQGHDFYEGVRAVLVDKDGKPKWNPSTLAAVTDADVNTYFTPLEHVKDLEL